jgi:hypothetical protein
MRRLIALPVPTLPIHGQLEDCWLWQDLKDYKRVCAWYHKPPVEHSVGDNPQKNSLFYHIVQAQKAEWLEMAAHAEGIPAADVYVWIDCGIFRLPGVTADVIIDFMRRVDGEQSIVIPGCWDKDFIYSDRHPIWRFCGGVIIMPRQYAGKFFDAVRKEYRRWLDEHNLVTWDVNTLARVEQRKPELPLSWFRADHDASMFTNYRARENTDDQKITAH